MFNKKEANHQKTIETIIGPSVKVEGNFKGEGDLVIEGMLVGSLQTKKNLKIGSEAIVEAGIKANNAFISGKVKGNVVIKGKLEITNTAVILGDIKAQIISIETGALINGQVTMPIEQIITTKEKKQEKKNEEEINIPEEKNPQE